jgi:ADP-heptose:LPS heptosyltransferase/GT2 family glycosyltransferase
MADEILTISIAAHNALEYTQRCLESIKKHTSGFPFKIVFSDNASTDDTVKYVRAMQEELPIEIVENQKNLGFIDVHNAAFAKCDTKYFLVLNNDITMCAGWLGKMMAEFEKDPAVVSCGVKNTCIALNDKGLGVPGKVPEYIEGSCMLVEVASIRKLEGGLFDTLYKFGYYEDSDLGLRIRKAGMRIAVVDIPVIHVGGATSRTVKGIDLDGYKIRNRHLFVNRWGDYLKNRSVKPISKDRIVIKRAGAQGDVILATPIMRALRVMYPMSVISVQTTCTDVLLNNPDINEAAFMVPQKDGDYVIDLDLAYERVPGKHIVEAYADAANIRLASAEDWRPRVFTIPTARTVAAQRMPTPRQYAVIHPGLIRGWVGRQWPLKRFTEVAKALETLGYITVLVGSVDTPAIGTHLDFRSLPFVHLVALIERASLFVGLDSMPFHVAQALGIKSVALFGSVDPALRVIPGGPVVPVVAAEVACLGCHHWQSAPRTCTAHCLRGTDACMEKITVDQVVNAIMEIESKKASIQLAAK